MIYIYGAGKIGIKYANLLREKGIKLDGFVDTFKKGNILINDEIYSIVDIKNVNRADTVIISVLDLKTREEILARMGEYGIKNTEITELLYKDILSEDKKRQIVRDYHLTQMDDYFNDAEKKKILDKFWAEDSIFKVMFDRLDLKNVVELACGRGRHVARYIEKCQNLTLVDYQKNNIEFCKERFKGIDKIQYYCNNGKDLNKLADNSFTSIFTYDSMVHFELIDIYSYLKEIYRVLENGGMALIHHSNNTEDYRIDFTIGTMGRNYMSNQIFAYLSHRAGLTVLEQKLIDWGGYEKLDCLSLLRKDA